MKRTIYTLIALLLCPLPLMAASFVIESGELVTTTQTLAAPEDTGLIKENGEIVVTAGNGVSMLDTDQTVLNKGLIVVADVANSSGIFSDSENATITNKGNITTTGDFSSGITTEEDNAVIRNAGLILTVGQEAHGIFSQGNNISIKNTGGIFIANDAAAGISYDGINAKIINTGFIVAEAGFGMRLGFLGGASNTVVINSGLISTSGDGGHGIEISSGVDIIIFNSGEILAEGVGANGIAELALATQVVNSGTIRSAQAFSLSFGNSSPTITLLRGSNLQGLVDSGAAINLNVETGLNLALTLTPGSPGFGTLGIEAPYALVGNTIAVVDPTGLAMQSDVLADLTDTILDGIFRYPSCRCDCCKCGAWVQGIGSFRNRSHSSEIVGYKNSQGGFIVGYETSICSGNANVFGGVSYGKAEIDQKTQCADTSSYFGGLTYEWCTCNAFIGLAVVGGYVDWDNKRNVMNNLLLDGGVETAHFDTGGGFISPEATIAYCFDRFWCSPIARLTLRYAGLFLGDYEESGTATDLYVKDREIDLLTTRLELGKFFCSKRCQYCWSFEPYVGVFGRFQVGGNTVDAELLGLPLQFDPGQPRNLAAFLLGFRGNQSIGCFNLFVNMETSFDNESSTRFLGEGGIEWIF